MLLVILTACANGDIIKSKLAELEFAGSSDNDDEVGRAEFLLCSSCHSMDPNAASDEAAGELLGPHLAGIVGRPVASVDAYEYPQSLADLDFVWDEARLLRWLEHPQVMIPSMCLPFMGISDERSRRDLLEFLRSYNG